MERTDWGTMLPPEIIADLGQNGGDFGWPYCYGDRIPDTTFNNTTADRCKD